MKPLYQIANSSDLDRLNQFIRASKGYWGYSAQFLDQFIAKWGIDQQYCQTTPIYLMHHQQQLIALFALQQAQNTTPELDFFFIHPDYIGQGIGRMMWSDVIYHAINQQLSSFKLLADPGAEAFYLKMGAHYTNDEKLTMNYTLQRPLNHD